jgi:hypothetical protein
MFIMRSVASEKKHEDSHILPNYFSIICNFYIEHRKYIKLTGAEIVMQPMKRLTLKWQPLLASRSYYHCGNLSSEDN